MDKIPDFSIEISPQLLQKLSLRTGETVYLSSVLDAAGDASMEEGATSDSGEDSGDDTKDNTGDTYHPGCIKEIVYSDLRNITQIVLQNGRSAAVPVQFVGGMLLPVDNINDYKELLEEAACCGHWVSFKIRTKASDATKREIHSFKLFPKQCTCC